ncbi:MAG: glycosyltransferase family 39 protein [Nanoarchaeota archaeon]|nr:glycosyltransferase family 39 protein [Nanoarchaeota archaeon]
MKSESLFKILAIFFLIFTFAFKIYIILNGSIGFDEAGIVYVAEGMADGGQLYTDYFDHKPPFMHYLLSFFYEFANPSVLSIKSLAFLFDIILLASIYFIAARLSNKNLAIIALSIAAIYNISLELNTETLMAVFGLWSFYFYTKALKLKNFINSNLFIAGIFLAIAIWFKQTAVIFYVAFLIHVIYLKYKKVLTGRESFRGILMLTLGVLIISIPLLSYFLFKVGYQFIYSLIEFNLLFKGSSSRILQLGKGLNILVFYLGFLLVIILSQMSSKLKQDKIYPALVVFNIVNLLFILSSQEIFYQHFFQLVPFTILLAVYSLKNAAPKIQKILFLVIILGLAIISLSTLEQKMREIRSDGQGTNEVLSYLNATVPKDTIFFSDTPIYTLLGGYTLNQPLVGAAPSFNSVFDYKFVCNQDYIVLTHRQNYLSPEVQECVNGNFTLLKRFDNIGESFVEIKKLNK